MATRKKVSKKSAGRRARKTGSRRKAAVKKKPASKRGGARKSTRKANKKPAGKKKSAASKKKVAKKSKKKVTKKKAAKKKVSKKKPAKKKASKKKAAKKKVSKKKPAKKKASKKKAVKKKPAHKAPAGKRRARGNGVGRRRAALPGSDAAIHGIKPYHARAGENYMNEEQLEHFSDILLAWKTELMEEVDRTVHHMQDEASNFPDPNDRATQESEFGLELRTRDRERKLLKKIDQAMARIDDGSYGFCEETGEAIGLKRLEARPVATLSVEAQERREVAERQYRDQDDRYR